MGGLLFNGNSGTETFNIIHVGLVLKFQELTGISGKAFHIAPLPFGIDGIEGQTGFA
jgi:hypothetical protein